MRNPAFPATIIVAVAVLISGSLFYFAPRLASAADCSSVIPGSRPATAEDVAKIEAANGSTLPIGSCLTSESLTILGLDGTTETIKYLEGKLCAGKTAGYDGSKPAAQLKEENVYFSAPRQGGMDPKFLGCVKRLIEAATQRGLNLCLSAAYRTSIHQAASAADPRNSVVCGRAGPVTSCPHVRGIAVDINEANNRYAETHQLAQSIGLKVPLPYVDKWHIESGGGECGIPNFSSGATPVAAPAQTSQLSNAIRQALGMQQQPPPPQPPLPPQPQLPPQPALPTQPQYPQSIPPVGTQNTTPYPSGTCTPKFYCSGTSYYYRTSTCVDQVYQACPYGCASSGTTCAATTTNTNNSGTGTSTYDLINAFANPVSDSIDIGTIVSIALNDSTLGSTTGLQGTSPTVRIASGTIAINQGYIPQQTFTSGDLANNPVWGVVPQQNGALARLLTTMRDTLIYVLNYLRPFGGIAPRQGPLE